MLEIPNNSGENIQCDVNKNYVDNELKKKVDIVEGKYLSTNDYTNEDKEKLISLNNYTHPKTHNASIINQDVMHRFVTDEEKAIWNAKSDGDHNHAEYANKEHTHTGYATNNHNHDATYAKKIDLNNINATQINGKKIWTGTQQEYDRLGTMIDAHTLYFIVEG